MEQTIKLWEVETGRELRTLAGRTHPVFSVAFSPDGKTLASGSMDNTIKLWEVGTGWELHTLAGHTENVKSVAFSPDGKTLASGSHDQTIKIWEVRTAECLATFDCDACVESCAVFGNLIASAAGARVHLLKIENLKLG